MIACSYLRAQGVTAIGPTPPRLSFPTVLRARMLTHSVNTEGNSRLMPGHLLQELGLSLTGSCHGQGWRVLWGLWDVC